MTDDSAKRAQGCLRFSILNLLLLTTVVGLLFANWRQRRTTREQQTDLMARAQHAEDYIIRQAGELRVSKEQVCSLSYDRAQRLLERGEREEAIAGFQETAELQKRLLGFRQSTRSIRALIDIHLRAGDRQAAEPYLVQLIDYLRQRDGQYYSLTPQLSRLGLIRMDQQRPSEAEELFREALELRRERPDWVVYDLTSLVGSAAAQQGRHAEAEGMLLEGYQGLVDRQVEIPEEQREVKLMRAASYLVLLYEQWGKQELAGEWRSRAKSAAIVLVGEHGVEPN